MDYGLFLAQLSLVYGVICLAAGIGVILYVIFDKPISLPIQDDSEDCWHQ